MTRRRQGHVDFINEFERLRLANGRRPLGRGPGDIEDQFDPLYQRLTVVRIFGWDEVHNAVGLGTPQQVCVYDRGRSRWSEAADSPQDGVQTAADRHTLLDRPHAPGP
jgi:hypothetical protein